MKNIIKKISAIAMCGVLTVGSVLMTGAVSEYENHKDFEVTGTTQKISNNQLFVTTTGYTEKTDATRGEIVDRNGVGLVVNTTKYKIVLNKLYIEEDRLDGILLELADILTKTGDTRTDSLPISVGSDGSCVYKTSREEDAEKLLSSDFLDIDRNTSADDCFDALLKRY